MADPMTAMTAVSMGMQVAGGITGASGAEKKGQAQAAMYGNEADISQYQAGIALQNQAIAGQNSELAVKTGESQAMVSGIGTSQKIGTIRAAQGAGGLDVNSGSAKLVQDSQAQTGEFEQASIRSDAARKAYGYEVQGWQYGEQSRVDELQAKGYRDAAGYAKEAGDINAMTSILGGASGAADKWMNFKRQGAV